MVETNMFIGLEKVFYFFLIELVPTESIEYCDRLTKIVTLMVDSLARVLNAGSSHMQGNNKKN